MRRNLLIVDLNNFARYPTLAIGYIVANLRGKGHAVSVLSPLNFGVAPFQREKPESIWDYVKNRVYFSGHPLVQKLNEPLRKIVGPTLRDPKGSVLAAFHQQIQQGMPNAVLLSAYLNHRPSVEAIAAACAKLKITVILGGPAFNQASVSNEWLDIPGVSAIFGGEADLIAHDIVEAVITGQGREQIPGLFFQGGTNNQSAAPLHNLERLPAPDFSDFPWHKYPHKIIPMITGRGCSWGICTFCSDVITANGRGFRSRGIAAVKDELITLSERHHCKDFVFLDMKLNSDLKVWGFLTDQFQQVIPGGHWVATVHVDGKGENGLSREQLFRARASGLVRLSFGLESGSQKLNASMAKGTLMSRNETFVQDASDAGISLRASLMLGYPGEKAEDVEMTNAFLERHFDHFDRVRLSRFKAIPGTRFAELYGRNESRYDSLEQFKWDFRFNRAQYAYSEARNPHYRKAKRHLLQLVNHINRKPFRDSLKQFDGLM